jgi:hypothetical protein
METIWIHLSGRFDTFHLFLFLGIEDDWKRNKSLGTGKICGLEAILLNYQNKSMF